MGGDYAPRNLVEGAVLALGEYARMSKLFLVGDETAIKAELARLNCSDPGWRWFTPAKWWTWATRRFPRCARRRIPR